LLAERQVGALEVRRRAFCCAVRPETALAHLFVGDLSQGFVDAPRKLVVLSDEDIFGARAKRKRVAGGRPPRASPPASRT
jgi:hypothetical protein